jgi:DNA repair photolyase
MSKTKIEWTEYSWNPSVGCENKCEYCYARKLHNKRYKAYLAGKKLPVQYAKPFEEIQLFPNRLNEPLHIKKHNVGIFSVA